MNGTGSPQNKLTFTDQLESLIFCNRKAIVEMEGTDFIRLKVDLQLTGMTRILAKFFPVRNYRRYLLTDFSYRIYKIISENPIKVIDLIYDLQDLEKLSFFEARNLILQYIGNLMRRGLIAVEVPKTAANIQEEKP